jgi:hypothetical protein
MKRAIPFLLTAILTAQSAPEVEITAEPHHHEILTNAQVRVFSVDVAPHTDTLLHWHRHDYIYVMLGPAEVVNAVQAKDPVTIKLQDAQVGFTPGPFAHIVRNQAQPFRNVTIELLQDDQLHHSIYKWDESRGLDILHGGTKEILWVKDAVRVSEFELQTKAIAPISPAPYLLVALSDLMLFQWEHNAPMSSSMIVDLKPGEVRWIPAHHRSMLMNRGPAAKFITLEFP